MGLLLSRQEQPQEKFLPRLRKRKQDKTNRNPISPVARPETKPKTAMDKKKQMMERRREWARKVDAKNLVTRPDSHSIPFSEDSDVMAEAMKRRSRIVLYNENDEYLKAEEKRRRKIREDPILRKNYTIPEPVPPQNYDFESEADQILESFRNKKKEKMKGNKYTLPTTDLQLQKQRIRIVSNITGNKNEVIPVYCDLSKSLGDVSVPNSLTFKYTNRNVFNEFAELEEEFKKGANVLKCACHSSNGAVNCWDNVDCPCYQKNLRLRELQKMHPLTTFQTFQGININHLQFYNTIGFACCSDCGCGGQCTNNITMLLEKKLLSLSLEREQASLGFSVKSLNFIPPGTVIAEMTGELSNKLPDAERDYSFDIVDCTEGLATKLLGTMDAYTPQLEAMMKQAYRKNWKINTAQVGNVGRMLNHSCDNNCGLVRVYQGGFSPSHCRLFLVVIKPIFPGDHATIDYGEAYQFPTEDGCKCNSIRCPNTNVGNITREEITNMLKTEYTRKYNDYQQFVLGKLKKPAPTDKRTFLSNLFNSFSRFTPF